MTICVYVDRTLYSDRAGIGMSRPMQFIELKKLYVSPCSRFAMAVSGENYSDNEYFKSIMGELGGLLKQGDAFNANIQLTPSVLDFMSGRTIIVMTHRKIYALGLNDNESKLIHLDTSLHCTVGSGAEYASIALQAGKTAMEAIRISSITDPLSYLTDVDSISMSELYPF